MTPDEIHVQLDELDTRVDRLRATYEQYFTGIERLEPHVQKKDVERRFQALRKVQMRNTALRFRFQTLVQKYTAYLTYWQRICRQIEEGTYRRDLVRAQRYGQGIARQAADDAEAVYELDITDVESDDDPVEAVEAVDRVATAPRPDARPRGERVGPVPVYQASGMVEEIPLDVYGVPASIVPPPPAAVPAPPAPMPPRASPTLAAPSQPSPARPAPAAPAAPRTVPGAPAPPPPAAPAPAGIAPPPGARRAFISPFGAPRAGAPALPPPAASAPPAAPPAPPAVPVKPQPARTAAPPEASSAVDPAIRALYERYRDARRRNGEGEVSFDQVARQVRETMPRLEEKYRDQDVTLDVSEKDGKTVLRPVVKPRRP